jgi:Chaperone of endosialidase
MSMPSKQQLHLRSTVLAFLVVASLSVNSTAKADCLIADNTCYGTDALVANTDGHFNSGFGFNALYQNTFGYHNTAIGYQSLLNNTYGSWNTASGANALWINTTGQSNTANGYAALHWNTEGHNNSAIGEAALYYNETGYNNSASGTRALYYNTEGYFNTANGSYALHGNSTGIYNTASGAWALNNIATGSRNTADGVAALYNATGSRNVALGYYAGYNITSGADNIIIGAGQRGNASDKGVIRIGSRTFQSKAFIAGVRGVTTGRADAVPVVIDANGQLGTISSSRRFKEDIQPMGSVSERLLDLRPVTFRYKQHNEDGGNPVQFGLIAEEVAEAFPELVVRDASGNVETVSYHLLSSLLVNELQKEHRVNESQAARIASLEAQVAELTELKSTLAKMAQTVERLNRERLLAAN